ncbi:MAG: hypothetical protein NTW19_21570 [Planctomycetota bacterium]|nr:hypothetical protein [Planctomycetota bacterium]
MRLATPILACLALATCFAASAHAQTLVPVDQAVGDLDPLSRSQRSVQLGLRSTGEQSALFEVRPDPATLINLGPIYEAPSYYRIGPGFNAHVDRLDYLVATGKRSVATNQAPRRDGEFIELIPANTVFDLRPETLAAMSAPRSFVLAPYDIPLAGDPRLNRRADAGRSDQVSRFRVEPTRIERQINTQIDNRLLPQTPALGISATGAPVSPARK